MAKAQIAWMIAKGRDEGGVREGHESLSPVGLFRKDVLLGSCWV